MIEEYIAINFTYFKHSGKFYCTSTGKFDKALFTECTFPREYGKVLREAKLLPGLQDGVWSGPFVVHIGTYPELVLAKED